MLLRKCDLDITIAKDYQGLFYHGYQTVGSFTFKVQGSRFKVCVCVCVCVCVV